MLKSLYSFAPVLVTLFSSQANADCSDDLWPVYAGGQTGSEDVRCFVYDPLTELLLVGGVTNSEDFGFAQGTDVGFMYALD